MVRPPPIRYADTAAALERAFERATALSSAGNSHRALGDSERSAVRRWLELLCEWNARIDLTAARSGGELVDLMLADALALSPHLAAGQRVVDVGTGAGAPGLALALLRPDLAVTLCEPLAKRASFLRTVIGSVKRTDVTIVAKRGEELAAAVPSGASPGGWDEAMARATLPPEEWVALGGKLAKPGGGVWVLLASGEPPAYPRATITVDERYAWPETDVTRRAIRYVAQLET